MVVVATHGKKNEEQVLKEWKPFKIKML
jgi:hypothetical protein